MSSPKQGVSVGRQLSAPASSGREETGAAERHGTCTSGSPRHAGWKIPTAWTGAGASVAEAAK
jgi:hypothetical protein